MNRISTARVLAGTILLVVFQAGCHDPGNQDEKGLIQGNNDIGECGLKGRLRYDPGTQIYTLSGSGENIWFGEDQFHFAWIRLSGDFILRADVGFPSEGSHQHRKAGLMIRSSLDSNSPHVSAVVHGDGLTSLQYRTEIASDTREKQSVLKPADMLQLERKGENYIFSGAVWGDFPDTLQIGCSEIGDEVYAGLFICSHDNNVMETAEFRNFRVIRPAAEDFVPYRDYTGSNFEVMDVETGLRRILFSTDGAMQAPNWSPDGGRLVYNLEGLLYSFDLKGNTSEVIPSGFAVNNNNDHVLSFDGRRMGISNHSENDEGKSIIYIIPSEGGDPVRVTERGPSYLHGWSPDGSFLVYTAEREGAYNIYRIGTKNLAGERSGNEGDRGTGRETKLTDTPGLDDGPEYSPDGKFIYFNSARTGRMKLWRMKADGTGQEQLTFDEYNDWFPHVSPDGKWILFLSYMPEVEPSDHPWYKHVFLRKMPAGGGDVEVLAYVYGGQGTINVNSWSPDSKKIAFISNTAMTEEVSPE